MIDGKYNQKVNSKLNNIYFRGSDMQNKILFKNMTNDLLKAYAGQIIFLGSTIFL